MCRGRRDPESFEEPIAGGEEAPDLVGWETVTDGQGASKSLDLFTTDDERRLVNPDSCTTSQPCPTSGAGG